MADKNPITGDLLQSRMNSKEFEDNFDRIFRRKETFEELHKSMEENEETLKLLSHDELISKMLENPKVVEALKEYEYELNQSTGEVEKRFIDGVSKPNGEQFGDESDSTES